MATLDPRVVLLQALQGVPGWRSRARVVLGLTEETQCPICLRWFDGHRSGKGKTCGRPVCKKWQRKSPALIAQLHQRLKRLKRSPAVDAVREDGQ